VQVDPLEAAFEHFRAGQIAEAEAAVRARLDADGEDPNAWRLYGMIAQQLGKMEFAAQAMARAVRLAPEVAEFHFSLGNVHRSAGNLPSAVEAYRAALALRPGYSDAMINLGLALSNLGDVAEAEAAWMGALALDANDVDALANLCALHRDAGRLARAIEFGERAVAARPARADSSVALSNLGSAYSHGGQLDQAIECCRRAIAVPGASVYAHSNLLLNLAYHGGVEPAEVFAEHRRFNERHAAALTAAARNQPHANDHSPQRRLRIGYVSADFRDHAVAYFVEPILAHHSTDAVEVFCYTGGHRDAVTQRLQAHGHTWRSLVGVDDSKAAELIRGDGIDILIDLAVHTGQHRLLLFARRPAPVQATYLGYAGTTGLDAIDWRITDAIVDPPGDASERFHSERLMRLPRTQWCYQPPADAPDVAAAPPVRSTGVVTFGAATNLAKVTPQVIELWSRVLRATPGSRFAMKARSLADAATCDRMAAAFAAHGIERARLTFEPAGDMRDYLRFLSTLDIALDTFPFAGGTTTCHTLFMGVPVVTLTGQTSVSRVGASVLTNVGVAELIAKTPEEFVARATELARDRARLAEPQATLRPRMLASPLCDAATFVRDLEAAYRRMWQAWAGRT
jgi:predicted O-linked N-acetylglucosamine transferase (SPINDLY family)